MGKTMKRRKEEEKKEEEEEEEEERVREKTGKNKKPVMSIPIKRFCFV